MTLWAVSKASPLILAVVGLRIVLGPHLLLFCSGDKGGWI